MFTPLVLSCLLAGLISPVQEVGPPDPALKAAPENALQADVQTPPGSRATVGTLAKVRAYFRDTKSLKARFKQRSNDGSIVYGDLAMLRPGKARFDYDGKESLLLVSDGDVVSLIDYEVQDITRWPVSDTPLRLLLADDLNLSGYRAQLMDEQGSTRNFVLHAEDPKNRDMGIISMRFADLGESGIKLLGWRIMTPDGGVTFVDLSESAENIALDPKLWTFKDPRGAATKRRRRR